MMRHRPAHLQVKSYDYLSEANWQVLHVLSAHRLASLFFYVVALGIQRHKVLLGKLSKCQLCGLCFLI